MLTNARARAVTDDVAVAAVTPKPLLVGNFLQLAVITCHTGYVTTRFRSDAEGDDLAVAEPPRAPRPADGGTEAGQSGRGANPIA